MSKWTPEAESRLQDYLEDLSRLARAQGYDEAELVSEIRDHIVTETESAAEQVVTLGHVEHTLAVVGNPEGILCDGPVSCPAGAPSGKDAGTPVAKGYRFRKEIVFLALVVPAFSLAFEMLTGAMATLYFNPVPTWGHVLAGITVLLSIVLAHWTLVTPPDRAQSAWWRLVLILNGFAATWVAFYAVVYAPMLLISTVAIIAFGLGAMGLAPLFCSAAAVYQARCLHRRYRTLDLPKGKLLKYSAFGCLLACVCGVLIQGPLLARQHALAWACSADEAQRAKGLERLRLLHGQTLVLERCYSIPWPREERVWQFLGMPTPDAASLVKVYYQLTGSHFIDHRPAELFPRSSLALDTTFDENWTETIGDDSGSGTPLVKGLSLASSALDMSLRGDSQVSPDAAWGYLEWTLEFRNAKPFDSEARAHIAIPDGGVASRLTLWIEGEECEAAFGGRKQVKEAYRDVAFARRRDPALLTSVTSGQVFLQCFPVPRNSALKVRIGITAPLMCRAGNGYLMLPRFVARNFSIDSTLKHKVWIEAGVPVTSGGTNLIAETSPKGGYTLRGEMSNQEIETPASSVLITSAANPAGSVYRGSLSELSATMSIAQSAENAADASCVCLVIDGSRYFAETPVNWAGVVSSLPQGTQVNAVFAGQDVEVWSESFQAPDASLVGWLEGFEYTGGCDPIPALTKACEIASPRPNACIIWIHGPQPITLSSADGLTQFLRHRGNGANAAPLRILSVPLVTGRNRTEEAFGFSRALTRIPVLGSIEDTLHFAVEHRAAEDVVRTYDLSVAASGPQQEDAASHSDIVRLAVYDQTCQAVSRGDKDEIKQASAKAIRTRLVTPLSGAVVLENQEQYKDHALDPGRDEDAIPAIPEPEEWVLLALAVLVVAGAALNRGRRRAA
jgi:hypothetical protein